MSDALAPLPGDPASLAVAAERLGGLSARMGEERERFHDGSATVTVSVMRSDSAFRLGVLHDALRGVEAAYERVEASGTGVAADLEEHARAWRRVEDELADLREEVARAEDRAQGDPDDGARARRTRAEAEARGEHLKRVLLAQRAALVGEVRSRITGYDPSWTEVPASAIRHAALESVTTRAHRALAAGTISSADAWQVLGWAYGEVADDDARAWRGSTTYQVLGGLDEFQRLLRGSVTDTGEALLHPVDALEGVGRFSFALQTDPLHTVPTLAHGFVDPFTAEWADGEYGRAVGRGLATALGVALGAKGATRGLRAAREGETVDRIAAGAAAFRSAREAARLRRVGRQIPGSSTWVFAHEVDAARAMANPVAGSTYRVHHEELPTDYVFDDHGQLRVVRGPATLLREDVPVPSVAARQMAARLEENGWQSVTGFNGGRRWKNEPGRKYDAARLPAFDREGSPITYREYDVHARGSLETGDRGEERLVRSGLDVWYTDDHYQTFVRLR